MSILGKILGIHRNEDYEKAIRLFDQGRFEEAIDAFALAHKHADGDALTDRLTRFYTAEANSNLGQTAHRKGAWEKAENHFRKALVIHPHYADLHFNLAQTLRRQLKQDEALQSLDTALKINPRFAKAHFHKGLVLYSSGQRDEAMKEILSSVELEPGFGSDAYHTGLRLHEVGDFIGALNAFEMVSATEVEDILFHYRLADDLHRRGKFSEAAVEYSKALDLNPNYADIRNHYGLNFVAQGHQEEAAAQFEQALKVNPGFVAARLNLAAAYQSIGRFKDAAAEFSEVLKSEPDNPLALQNLEEMKMSRAA